MRKVKLKPLSVNKAWQGRRFKTVDYSAYEFKMTNCLPNDLNVPKEGLLELNLVFGVSNKGSDIDNPIKPFLDILQKKYDFNDSRIYKMTVIKKHVAKYSEFVEFDIKTYEA